MQIIRFMIITQNSLVQCSAFVTNYLTIVIMKSPARGFLTNLCM